MGLLNSRVIVHEVALKRCTDKEILRWKRSFQRLTPKEYMDKSTFINSVLGGNVPSEIADRIYRVFATSQSEGISQKEFISGMVIFLKGTTEEKIKFAFYVYDVEDFGYISKEEMGKVFKSTNVSEESRKKMIEKCFKNTVTPGRMTYKEWKKWVDENKNSDLPLIGWIYEHSLPEQLTDSESEDEESDEYKDKDPSDLAKSTHFSETEISYLSKQYEKLLKDRPYSFQGKGNQIDRGVIMRLFCPPLPDELAYNLFNAFTEEGQEMINFEHFLCGLSVFCRGNSDEKLKFIFKVFDKDKDNKLTKTEFHNMIKLLWRIETKVPINQTKENKKKEVTSPEPKSQQVSVIKNPKPLTQSSRGFRDKLHTNLQSNNPSADDTIFNKKQNALSKSASHKLQMAPDPAEILVEHAFLEKSFINKKEQSTNEIPQEGSIEDLPKENLEEFITLDEYLQWSQTDKLATQCLTVLKRIANTNIGLPSTSKKEEKELIKHFLEKSKSNLTEGDTVYVISAKWWHQWTSYVGFSDNDKPLEDDDEISLVESSRPGMIDNTNIYVKNSNGWSMSIISYFSDSQRLLSGIPRLKPGLKENQDYYLVSLDAWKALVHWYGCSSNPLPCKVISTGKNKIEVEVYPLHIVFKLEPPAQFPKKIIEYAESSFSRTITLQEVKKKACSQIGVSTMAKIRLWSVDKDATNSLEEKLEETLESAKIKSGQTIILERQQRDGSWPRGGKEDKEEQKPIYPIVPGVTGLRNLGNTCFMNSSLQCLSNTPVLTTYFVSNRYLVEINKDNPLGMNGHVAKEYGSLVKEMWPTDPDKKSTTKNYVVVPKDLKWVIGKFAPQFSDFRQQDAQEFLSFLLDGLHEDLNRISKKPYTQNPDYNGQPDKEFAQSFWEIYLKRNMSIIVDLFHGQFKSTISYSCGSKSITFDPMTFLSLPLPIDEKRSIEIYFFYIDKQERPIKVSVLVDREEGTVQDLLKGLSDIVDVPTENIVLTTVENSYINNLVYPWSTIKSVGDILHAYELIGCPPNFKEPPKGLVDKKEHINGSNLLEKSLNLGESDTMNEIIEEKEKSSNNIENSDKSNDHDEIKKNIEVHKMEDLLILDENDNHLTYLRVLNRKVQKNKFYFFTPYSSTLFSSPTILSFDKKSMTNRNLYEKILHHLKFMVDQPQKKEETETNKNDSEINSNQFPFDIRLVNTKGTACSRSPWYNFNIGTLIPPNDDPLDIRNDETISIDWKVDVKNYHKTTAHGDWFIEHPSVQENWEKLNKPISLDQCISWFTQDENLPDEIICPKCKQPEKTKKKLEIWKPPKILILHLKRFVYYNNRWIKSNRLVEFPINNLEVSNWLIDKSEEPLAYDLFATVNHFGRLGGGHYTSHAKNFNNNTWYNFDDHYVKPLEKEEDLVSNSAYLLFYKVRGLKEEDILVGEPPEINESDERKAVGKIPQKDDENSLGKSLQTNCACM